MWNDCPICGKELNFSEAFQWFECNNFKKLHYFVALDISDDTGKLYTDPYYDDYLIGNFSVRRTKGTSSIFKRGILSIKLSYMLPYQSFNSEQQLNKLLLLL